MATEVSSVVYLTGKLILTASSADTSQCSSEPIAERSPINRNAQAQEREVECEYQGVSDLEFHRSVSSRTLSPNAAVRHCGHTEARA